LNIKKYIYRKDYLEYSILSIILIVYSFYSILFSTGDKAKNLLVIFVVLSYFVFFTNSFKNRWVYLKSILFFLLFYFLLSYLSIFITTKYANIDYLYEKFPDIIFASMIPIGFYNIKNFNKKYFKNMLTILLLLMAGLIILLNSHILKINNVEIFDYILVRNDWTQKNYTFWYVLLMYGTISFYDIKKTRDRVVIIAIFALSYFVIFYGYSFLARVDYVAGLFIYVFLSIFNIHKKYLVYIIWCFILFILLAPIILHYIDLIGHARLNSRNIINHVSTSVIKEHWLFGYGFGSTLSIKITDFVDISSSPYLLQHNGLFPGGHPHNVILLFWIEFGLIGGAFWAYFMHKLLTYIMKSTYQNSNQAGLFAMAVSLIIITFFSWSVWYPQVLLTFSFFGVMLVLSLNNNKKVNIET